MDREERARQRKKRRIRALIRLAIVLIAAGIIVFLFKAPFFNVKEFVVEGNHYYSSDEILTMGNCKAGGNIFIGTDMNDIKKRLEKDAYMESVKVRPKFPSTVVISLVERRQVAAVCYGEKYIVVDSNGIVLRKTSKEPKLTIVSGLTISKLTVGEALETEEKVQLRRVFDLLDAMNRNDMYFTGIEVRKNEMRAHVLKHLVIRGTADNIIESLENNNIQLVVQELFEKDIERGTIKVTDDSYITYSPKID